MMSDTDNMSAVIAAARDAGKIIKSDDGREWALYPQGARLEPIGPKHEMPPPYIVATRTFHDGNSLAAYANVFKGDNAQLFADIDSGLVTAILDHDGPDEPSVRRHVVTLPIRLDEAFGEWSAMVGKWHEQEEFLRFLEQNVSDVVTPEPAFLLELIKDFSGIRQVQFGQSIRLDNGDRQIAFKSETHTGEITIPQRLLFRMPIYYGEEAHDLTALFRYRVGDSKASIAFRLEWHRLEPVKQAAFRLAATRIAEACGLTPLFGKPS